MRNFKRIIALLVVLIFSISVVGCGSKSVATVNGEKITQTDLEKRMKKVKLSMEQQGVQFTGQQGQQMMKALEQQTLDDMITQALVEQAAKKEKVYPDTKEVKKAIDDIIASFGGKEKFNEALKQYGYTLQEIQELKAFDIARTNLFNKKTANVKVTEKDIKEWYDSHKDTYKDPAKIEARTILIRFDNPAQQSAAPPVNRTEKEAEKLAKDLIAQLKNGADFAKLAKEKSDDERSKNDGGLIKDMSGSSSYAKGTLMPKQFDDAALELKVGQITTEPVKTPEGLFIIKLEGTTPEKQLTFEEAKPKIEQDLPANRKQQVFSDYLTDLRTKSKITNNLAKETPQPAAGEGQLPPGHPSTTPQK